MSIRFPLIFISSFMLLTSCSNPLSDTTSIGDGSSANTAPSISTISDQSMFVNTSTSSLAFTINDSENTLSCSSSMSMSSSNTTLIDNIDVAFSGTAPNCTATFTPNTGQMGVSTLTLTVSDGALQATTTLQLTVNISLDFALTGLDVRIWLDAMDIFANSTAPSDGAGITAWNDKSGNSNDLSGTGGATYDAATTSIQFNNTAQPISGSYTRTINNSLHLFIVATHGGTGDNNMIVETTTPRIAFGRQQTGGAGTPLSSSVTWGGGNLSGREIMAMEYLTNTNQNLYRNGTVDATSSGAISLAATPNIFIGDDSTGGNPGQATDFIHEVLLINEDLSATEREDIEGAFACKWSIQSVLPLAHPYKSQCYR